jgi:hypothetical protein
LKLAPAVRPIGIGVLGGGFGIYAQDLVSRNASLDATGDLKSEFKSGVVDDVSASAAAAL